MSDYRLEISIDEQRLDLFHRDGFVRHYPVSTAAKGAGSQEGSHRTPTGRFAISDKIGHDAPLHTIFESRRPTGTWDGGHDNRDLILSRILRLDGLDPSNRNTRDRYIYLHGTNHETLLGTPASCGCIRMANPDIVELFERIDEGTPVVIHPPVEHRHKLAFFDCDSTLSSIEGIDELARARGPEAFQQVEALTNAAMNGEVPIQEVFPRRMEIIGPDRALCDRIATRYIETITPGTEALIRNMRKDGWTIVILSGGFAPLIEPLAKHLGISYIEAVPLYLDDDGNYVDYGADYATTRNGGKPEIIREWQEALPPSISLMTGDGISDLECSSSVDLFVGYGGVVEREKVRKEADLWLTEMSEFEKMVYPAIENRRPINESS